MAAAALREAAPRSARPLPPFALALFTDDRRQKDLLSLLTKIPRVSDIGSVALIFRHDDLPPVDRLQLAEAAMREMHLRGHFFLMARDQLAGADGCHACSGEGIVSWPVHSREEAKSAEAVGADFAFLSPVFPTASHPEATGLDWTELEALLSMTPMPAFALGGITPENAQELAGLPIYGIGAIGAWSE